MNDLIALIQQRMGGRGHRASPSASLQSRLKKFLLPFVLFLLAWSSFFTVQPEQRAVVKRFGAVVRTVEPGLNFKLPIIDSVTKVATERVLKEEFGFRTTPDNAASRSSYSDTILEESQMLTGDLNIVDVEWVVQYRIGDPMLYLYSMRDPVTTLRDISESVMRRAVGNRLGSEVLTTARVEISNAVRDEIQAAMERYETGIRVVTVEMQDVVPPQAVRPAYNEVNEARQQRERMINEANKQVNQQVPLAQGQAARTITEAEGYAAGRVNQAYGETARFRSILAEYRNAPQVTRSRLYLEALNKALPKAAAVVVSQSGQTGPVPLYHLSPKPAAPSQAAGEAQ